MQRLHAIIKERRTKAASSKPASRPFSHLGSASNAADKSAEQPENLEQKADKELSNLPHFSSSVGE